MEETRDFSDPETVEDDEIAESKVSPLLGGFVVLLLVLIFVLVGLIVRQVFFVSSDAPRTGIERDLFDAQALVKKDSSNPLAYYDLGLVYAQLGQDSNAVEAFNKALKLDKNLAEAHYQLGMIYLNQKDKSNAEKSFKKAMNLKPNFALASYQLATLEFEKEQYEKAAEFYKKTIEINPILTDPYYFLGVCYEKMGKKDLAIKNYKEALKYIPDYEEAKKALQRLQAGK